MNELETSRNEISRIDAEMAKLFEQRMQAAAVIARPVRQGRSARKGAYRPRPKAY